MSRLAGVALLKLFEEVIVVVRDLGIGELGVVVYAEDLLHLCKLVLTEAVAIYNFVHALLLHVSWVNRMFILLACIIHDLLFTDIRICKVLIGLVLSLHLRKVRLTVVGVDVLIEFHLDLVLLLHWLHLLGRFVVDILLIHLRVR